MNISTSACGATRDYQVIMVNADVLQKDTTICNNASVVLNARYDTTGALIKEHSFLWSTGETTASITVKPLKTTKYYVTVTVKNVSRKDSVTITVAQAPLFNPLGDTTRPATSPVKLDAGAGFARYAWSTAATTQSISATVNGKYKVSATTAQGCTVSDSTIVQFPDTLGLFIPVVPGLCGSSVDVPVRAYKVKDLLTMQGSITWNAADLRFESISNLGPVSLGLTQSNFGVSQTSFGIVTFSWNDPKLAGVNLPDTATLFVLRFTALTNQVKSIPVSISGSPTSLEFYDSYFRKKPLAARNGSVSLSCMATISGRIVTPLDEAVAGVELTLTGTESRKVVTDKSGVFRMQVKPGNYTLTPGKNNEKTKANGVSTLDVALIQAHVLNSQNLNSPYKVIAADADGSGAVSTVDMVYIRRMVLGMDTAMPGNRTWVFVDSAQSFANPLSPFPFTRTRTFTNLTGPVNQTFRAIKLGDVNWDRNPQVEQTVGLDTMKLYGELAEETNGEVVVKVRARDVQDIMGLQFTMAWNRDQLEFIGVGQNPLGISFGDRWTAEGYLGLSWNDPQASGQSMKEGDLLFELRFNTLGPLDRKSLQVGSWKVATEVFDKAYLSRQLVWQMELGKAVQPLADDVLRAYPNPAVSQAHLQWNAAAAGQGYVRLLDAAGKKVLEQKIDIAKGANRYLLALGAGVVNQGMYIVQVESEGTIRTTRILVTR